MALCNISVLRNYHYPLTAVSQIKTWATGYLFAIFGVGGNFIQAVQRILLIYLST